jgi:predicted tellurium resistance membrane protein TerC
MWAWAATLAVLAVLIAADLVLTKGAGRALRAAAVEGALWLAAALAFGGVLWLWRGPATGGQYLAGSVDRFAYLKQGIAILLVFIGTKMLLSSFVHLPTWVSLAVIAVVASGAVAASLWRDRTRGPREQQTRGEPVRT